MKRRYRGVVNASQAGNVVMTLPKLPPSEPGWLLEWFSFTLLTDATVATRQPNLSWKKAPLVAVPFCSTFVTTGVPATTTAIVTWLDIGAASVVASSSALVWAAGRLPIPGESEVLLTIVNGQAGDVIGALAGVAQPTTYSFVEAD